MLAQAGCGATYGVVPFVSRRSTGIVCGLVSAGGAVGGVINQAIFFLNTPAKGPYSTFPPLRFPNPRGLKFCLFKRCH